VLGLSPFPFSACITKSILEERLPKAFLSGTSRRMGYYSERPVEVWGFLWGHHKQFSTSGYNLEDMATTNKTVENHKVAGLLSRF